MADQHTNRLAREKSPYLLQHAHNPVDWYPWGEEAFTKARSQNKPIFLSIGYSTCHWCHVMERESFENEDVARILNARYVSIKVDREERPDVDAVYMSALQAMTGSGGWPMSVFLTPDLKPFFAGTYFPPYPAHGRPSFAQLIERIHELWESNRDALIESGEHITESLRSAAPATEAIGQITRDIFDSTFRYFENAYDRAEGGFGGAPKFPRPVQFDFLFYYSLIFGEHRASEMALHTLRKMALGGMHDHLGGGFHRYSVDRYWRVSHFEKMLYDQAQLLNSYLDAWQLTREPLFETVARDIIEYVLRDMTHPDGGFFSAEDADSEGEEGKFYAWSLAEIQEALGPDAPAFAYYYGITDAGNFEHGKSVLHVSGSLKETAIRFALTEEELQALLENGRRSLFNIRVTRIRPLLDDKVLVSWNGLMIGAMARAGDILNEPRFQDAALKAAEFIWQRLHPQDRLLHRWRQGESRFDAYLDDYAFLIKGYLDLYEAHFDARWLRRAIDLQREQDETLYDTKEGGYFNTREAVDLILRSKSDYDGAEPSGNSIAVQNLFRLAVLTEDMGYAERAEETQQHFIARVQKYPFAMPGMMAAAFWSFGTPRQIVLAGNNITPLKNALNKRYLPITVKMSSGSAVAPFARSLAPQHGEPTAYVCHNFVCDLPATSPAALDELLKG